MREFFRPFRRKLGALMLFVACGVTALWMRSDGRLETLHVCPGRSLFLVASRNGTIYVGCHVYETHAVAISKSITLYHSSLKQLNVGCSSEKSTRESHGDYWTGATSSMSHAKATSVWKLGDFIVASESHTIVGDEHETSFVTAPYWFLVFPLTLLAAWLLISKPRQPKEPVNHA